MKKADERRRRGGDLLAAHKFGSESLDLSPEVRGTDGLVVHRGPQALGQLRKLWRRRKDRKLDRKIGEKKTFSQSFTKIDIIQHVRVFSHEAVLTWTFPPPARLGLQQRVESGDCEPRPVQ